jgi:Regulator of Chromosome Condensation (RCC1) repeat protein/immunoglobulin I-set domain protein
MKFLLRGFLFCMTAGMALAQTNNNNLGRTNLSIIAGPLVNPANQHQYLLLEQASWTDAEATAQANGGHLVTVNDQEEHLWLIQSFSSYGGLGRALWIGLSDPNPSLPNDGSPAWVQHFTWASGQPVTFFTWSTDPNISSQGVGRMKMVQPDPGRLFDPCEWAEEADSALLNGVVEIPLPLEIASQPSDVSVGIGVSATLTVIADGTSPISYRWQFMGKDIPGATGPNLVLTEAQPPQSGSYTVIVSNTHGSLMSKSAVVSVQGVVGWGMSAWNVFDIPATVTNVIQLSSGVLHTLALRADGTVVAWGDNRDGQTDVPAGLSNVVAVAAGNWHSLALRSDGTVVGWGANEAGEATPPTDLTNATAIGAGGSYSLALTAAGSVACWGDYVVSNSVRPEIKAEFPTGLTNVVDVAAGGIYAMALRSDGTVVPSGDFSFGSINGTIFEDKAYVPPDLTNVVGIAAGAAHVLALKSDGTVVAWGQNDFGETNVPPNLTNVVAISAGDSRSVALRGNGNVVEWGMTMGDVPMPADLPDIVGIAAGGHFTMALLRDGAPHLTVQPWDQAVTNGSSPAFYVKAVGLQSMSYQWDFNGNPIQGATNDKLRIPNASSLDSGGYSVTASNALGAATSRQAKLKVGTGSTAVSPTILNLSVDNHAVSVKITGASGASYILESKDALNQTQWEPASSWTVASGDTLVLQDLNPLGTHRFYRVRAQ